MTGVSYNQARLLKAMGVDVWIPRDAELEVPSLAAAPAEVPVAEPAPQARPSAPSPVPAAPPPAIDLDQVQSLDDLLPLVRSCERCGLHQGRRQAVFGVGNPDADWMVIGEAPGAEEDRQGEPFVGRAGLLLNEMLRAVSLSRERVFIANILKCRPPNNRDPEPVEAESCRGYLEKQIELIKPRMILAVGRIAAQNLLGTEETIGRLRGTVYRYGDREVPLVVTYHPAYLLRSPGQKRKSWDDLKLARSVLESG